MKNLNEYKLVKDLLFLYKEKPVKANEILELLNDGMLNYYSIDVSINDLIKDIEDNKFSKEQFMNAFNYDSDTLIYMLKNNGYTLYKEDNSDLIIVLSDFPVLSEINANISGEEYTNEVSNELLQIEKNIYAKYNIKLELVGLGRSGRHIGFEINSIKDFMELFEVLDNIIEDYDIAENKFIEYINDTYN